MDWKTIGNYVLLVGLFVSMVTMFNGVNARIDALNERMDRMQAESNARFDAVLETIMSFDLRVSRIEGRLDAQSAGTAE